MHCCATTFQLRILRVSQPPCRYTVSHHSTNLCTTANPRPPPPSISAFAYFQGLNPLYAPLLSSDEVTREALSEKPEGLPGLPDLGVEMTPAGKVAITFLRQYRKHIYHDEHIEDKDTHATAA